MSHSPNIPSLLHRLWHHISLRRRKQFGLLLFLMIIASFAEIISIGAVLPFLGALAVPNRIFQNTTAQALIHLLDIKTPEQLLLPMTVVFCVAALFAGSMRLLLLWVNTRLSFATGADLSNNIYLRTLYQPYEIHISRNSSEIISAISTKTYTVINVIVLVLNLFSSSLTIVAILVTLLAIEPKIALSAFCGFGTIYALIIVYTRKQLKSDSQKIARESTNVIKSLQEGLGGIRDVLIDGCQDTYCKSYQTADYSLRRAQGNNRFISQSPRYVIEALGMLLIAVLAYTLAHQQNGLSSAIPTLGALALGAQRLLPLLQQSYSHWTTIVGDQASMHDALMLLEQPLPEFYGKTNHRPTIINFEDSIKLKQVSFRYSERELYVLKNINLEIKKGSRIGFIGATGSGKTTLLDIVMGLLQPTYGTVEVDGNTITANNYRAWQLHIAHVPQTIFLADSSIEENIAFGIPVDEIDHERARQAARQAEIADSIESWTDKYKTFVGERGVRLSGGQRQRIGIARALYKQADVIIFDEATSALDNETEQAVMQAIESLSENITILIIAHRLSTLKSCTQVVELGGGSIKKVGTYQDICNESAMIV